MVGAGLLQVLISIVDIYFAGQLGSLEQAAVSLVEIIRLISIFVAFAAAGGVGALVSQAYGAGNTKELRHIVEQAFGLTVIFAAVVSVIGFFAVEYAISYMNNLGDPLVVSYGTMFMKIYFAGFVLLMLNFIINGSLQATGDTVSTLRLAIIATISNIALTYLFTFGFAFIPAMGLPGIILGTVATWFLTASIGLFWLYSGKKNIVIRNIVQRPDIALYKNMLAIGAPAAWAGMATRSASIILFRILNANEIASFATAALGIGLTIEAFINMIPNATGQATASLFGQALGRWQIKKAKLIANVSIVLSIIVLLIIAIPLFIFAPQIMALFNKEANEFVVTAGSSYLRINAWTLPVFAISTVLIGILRAAGDTRPAFRSALISRWFVMLPFAYITTIYFGLGVEYIWWSLVLAKVFAAVYMLIRWLSNRWQDVALKRSLIYNNLLKNLADENIFDFLENIKRSIMNVPEATEEIVGKEIHYQIEDSKIVFRITEDRIDIVEGKDRLEQILVNSEN